MIDKDSTRVYTKKELEQVAEMAAKSAIHQLLHAPPNLDSQIEKSSYSFGEEGEADMCNTFRETYSYTDEQGNMQTVRFRGKNKRDTDAKFQEFLCNPKEKEPVQTLKEYVDNTYRKSFIDGLERTTKSNYERYLKSYILPFMGDMPMNQITLATIQEFFDWLACGASHGFKKDINKKSIDRIGGLLNRILVVAAEMKVITESPFKVKLLHNNGQPSEHHQALPDQEVDRVKRELPFLEDDRKRVYMGFLIYTGLRREEILGLQWDHIHLDEGYGSVESVVVYPDNKRPFVKEHPKTKHSERDFIIPKPLSAILNSVPHQTGYIIHGRDAQQPISLSTFQRMYREAFKELGIEHFNNHDWRTTYGTQLKEAGMTSAQVADVMGHADTRMVETVYAPRRHEGIMKHKNTIELLNNDYAVAHVLPT